MSLVLCFACRGHQSANMQAKGLALDVVRPTQHALQLAVGQFWFMHKLRWQPLSDAYGFQR